VGNVSAFGPRGADAGLAGMDMVIQARSGLMANGGRLREDGLPMAGDAPIADYVCAMTLAFGIASALLRRERTGRGGEVDVSLLMAALTLQNNSMVRVAAADGPAHAGVLARLGELRAAGASHAEQAAIMPGTRVPAATHVYYRSYTAKDGTLAVACASPALQRAMMRAMGLTDLAHARPMPDRADQERHYLALRKEVEALVASRTIAEWKALLDAHGVPVAGFRFSLEMLDDEHVLANGMLRDLDHPVLGAVRVLAPPVTLDGDGFQAAPATRPFGSEARALLAGLGFSAAEVERFVADGVTRESFSGPAPAVAEP